MSGLLVGGCIGGGHDRVNDTERDGFFSSDRRVLNLVGFKLPGDSHVQSFVGLGVGGLLGVWEASQEVGSLGGKQCLCGQVMEYDGFILS